MRTFSRRKVPTAFRRLPWPIRCGRDLVGELAIATAGTAANAHTILVGVAFVEALHVVGELLICRADELRQSPAREVAVLVVHRLDPRPIHGQQLPPEQVELTAKQDKFPEHLPERRRGSPGGNRRWS